MTELRSGTLLAGSVVSFDAQVGLGEVEHVPNGDASAVRYGFHCIEIADGTRDIAVGTPVTFELLAKFGRWEAARIRPA